ncbi:glutamine amidotransferase-related protein [Vulgatibacter incomptus]|uniref:GMP synthase n=1 Tax=Vulgatibacter incomptus TaxID=1391653 RepID=A0A0K1PEC3_9BACT|nr:hypothetical protein [Vulgatibacter incomptus]AKU91888.1 GMP synthase [Vulgatibacter incomptus]
MTLPRLLLLKAGSTHPDVVSACGDYDEWFRRALPGGQSRCETVAVSEGAELPSPEGYGGAIITGSPSGVRDEAPWMERLSVWALGAADGGLPILAVCFGHQLLGEALGGRVEASPRGWELGSVEVDLSPEGRDDPLFDGLPPRLVVGATHRDELVRPPSGLGARRLASNAHSPWQAFSAGPRIRAVQFHPEVDAAIAKRVLAVHGLDEPVRQSDHGRRILANWDRHFVRRCS